MKAIDQLSDKHILALARFIAGCARIRTSTRWRSHFAECASRNSFVPFVTSSDQEHLRDLVSRRNATVVCCLRTAEVMQAANQVASEWGESPIVLAAASDELAAAADG